MRNELRNLAAQIACLVPINPEQNTIYNFAFGSVYALGRAEELGYPIHSRRSGISQQRSDEVKIRAIAMKNRNHIPRKGEWLAGFYFNDSLMRADVCYEHVVRYYTKKSKGDINDLIGWAKSAGFPPGRLDPAWREIRSEVNKLKHKSLIFAEGPIISYSQATKDIKCLISAVEYIL